MRFRMNRKLKTTCSMTEARANWHKLIDRASKGESITLTRYGIPVAIIEPHNRSRSDAIITIRELRKGLKLGGISIRELIEEGRS